MPSPFEALIDDLAALRDRRLVRATVARPLRKSAPLPNYAPDWDSLSARQERIAADLEQSRIETQKAAIREHIATLMAAAKAGRLDPHSVCVLDVLRGRADSMGIAP